MRPFDRVRGELVEAGRTAAVQERDEEQRRLRAAEAIARGYAALPPDEQEAVRRELNVAADASGDDVGLALWDAGVLA